MKRGRYLSYLFLFVVAGSAWALDQLTKTWVRIHLPLGVIIPVWDEPIPVRIVHWFNRGGVFGLFQEFSWLWTVLSLVITAFLVTYYPQLAREPLLRWALALQLGGALGNLTDRLRLGFVTDFLSVGNFPVFNLADVFITLGIVILLLGAVLQRQESPVPAPQEPPSLPGSPLSAPSEVDPEEPTVNSAEPAGD